MKISLLLALALASFSAPASADERRYPVVDFDRVAVEGPYTVRLVTGAPSSALARGSREALDRVSIEVAGRTLRIRPNRSAWGGHPGESAGAVTIELATRDLRGGLVAGSGQLSIDGARGMRIDLTLEGSGRLSARNVRADRLSLGLIGSGRMEVSGVAEELRAEIHGTADLSGEGLAAENAVIAAETAGEVVLTVRETATVTAGGLGEVRILGNPNCDLRGLSAGQVHCGNR